MRKFALIAAPLLALTFTLAGCTDAAPLDTAGTTSETPMAPSISEAEYEAAYETFTECVVEGGAELVDEETVNGVHLFSYFDEDTDVVDACYQDFLPADLAWQSTHNAMEEQPEDGEEQE